MQTLAEIRGLLDRHGLSPRKALGQNFLIDKNLLARLIASAGVGPGSVALEVGPGTGTLTRGLLDAGARVVACEMDGGLCGLLREHFAAEIAGARLALIEGDCLGPGKRLNAEAAVALGGVPFALVANLPYQAGTPLMLDLLLHHPGCGVLAATIQREVGERLTAGPGSREYGGLAIMAQALAEAEWLADLPPECFWPRPKVESCMVVLRRRAAPRTADPDALAALCHRLFSKRRKQLGAILGRATAWPAGVRAEMRPEDLTVAQAAALAAALGAQSAG